MSKSTKQLGAIGLILNLVGSLLGALVAPLGVFILVGWVLVLIAYFKASEELGEPYIKSASLKAVVLWVAGIFISSLGGGTLLIAIFASLEGGAEKFTEFGSISLTFLIIGWLLNLVASWFWYKVNSIMSERSGIGLFRTGGLLIFVGVILSIVLIGGLFILAGEITLIVAFFSIKEAQT